MPPFQTTVLFSSSIVPNNKQCVRSNSLRLPRGPFPILDIFPINHLNALFNGIYRSATGPMYYFAINNLEIIVTE